MHLFGRGGRIEVVQRADVSAHAQSLEAPRTRAGGLPRSRTMRLFSPEHLAAIAVTVLAAVLLTVAARARRGCVDKSARRTYPTHPLRDARAGARDRDRSPGSSSSRRRTSRAASGRARVNLPLQLSDAVTLVAIAALWRPRAGLLDRARLVLGAERVAAGGPDAGPRRTRSPTSCTSRSSRRTRARSPPRACSSLGLRLAPRPRAALRALGWTAAFAVLAAIACLATGGNYMFLRRKPANGSILDALGPWPWYIAGAAALALAVLLVLELVARAGDAARAKPVSGGPRGPPLTSPHQDRGSGAALDRADEPAQPARLRGVALRGLLRRGASLDGIGASAGT